MTGIPRSLDEVKRAFSPIVTRASLLAIITAATSSSLSLAQTVPADPGLGCSVPATTVNGWFKSGTAALNGMVNPANSVAFPDRPNCSFYEWSYQMFLWLTSPTPPIYGGGGGRIFESSVFFYVSPQDTNGKRTMIKGGVPNKVDVFATQMGPNGRPLLFDKLGRLFEVQTPPTNQSARVFTKSGRLTEIAHARRAANGEVTLLGKDGTRIEPKLLDLPQPNASIPLIQKFFVDGNAVFLDRSGNLVQVEQNQADSSRSVLIAQNGSPIYFGIAVNEVVAYFRTQLGANVPANKFFPTTQAELDSVATFAKGRGKTFVEPQVLAFEIKTSWIESAKLSNVGDYITTTAEIPTYDKTDPRKWVKTGNTSTTVALIGMHVVGSAAGHPEMIWATFEHVGNTPNDAYSYINVNAAQIDIARETSGDWLFCATPCVGPFNEKRQKLNGNDIEATSAKSIGPDNIIRSKAWGAASNDDPNPLKNPAASNSEIISVNNQVRAVLDSADVRRKYIMTGSTWMIGGTLRQVGTSKLNNTTMETFTQGTDAIDPTKAVGTFNCFSCHAGNTTNVSRVFGDLKPF